MILITILIFEGQMSKKHYVEKYCRCDKAWQFLALKGISSCSYLEIDKFDFLCIKRCVSKITCLEEQI